MGTMHRLLALSITGLLALAGCETPAGGPGASGLAPAAPADGSWGPTVELASPDASGLDAVTDAAPDGPAQIEAFVVTPVELPVGGGEVEVAWAAIDAVRCALRFGDGAPVEVDTEGEETFDVTADVEVELECLGEDAGAAEATESVTVEPTPELDFDRTAPLVPLAVWGTVALVGDFDEGPAQYRLALDAESVLTFWGNVLPVDADAIVWLAADADADGQAGPSGAVGADDLIDGAVLDWNDRLTVTVPSGDYTVFVEPLGDLPDSFDLSIARSEAGHEDGAGW